MDRGGEARLDIGREAITWRAAQHPRKFTQTHAVIAAADAHVSFGQLQRCFVDFHDVAREPLCLTRHRLGREMHRGSGCHELPAGEAAETERRGRGVARNDVDMVGRDAQLATADLRQRGR